MYTCKYCGKEFDSKQKLAGHVSWCDKNPNKRDKDDLKKVRKSIKNTATRLKGIEVKCSHCGKVCKLFGLANHEKYCIKNPNKLELHRDMSKFNNGTYHAWNKGLTKETDERVRKNGESVSNSYKTGKSISWCSGLTKETDERIKKYSKKISNTINKKVKNDTWHIGMDNTKLYECNGYMMQGTWELKFVEFLNSKHINWVRPKNKFPYTYKEKIHYYYPDIYLPDYDLYIEIKGRFNDKDLAKWKDFPKDKKIDIYFGDELKELGIVNNATMTKSIELLNEIKIYRKKHINLQSL